jgi:DNA-binding GntR family transcriptional regulator
MAKRSISDALPPQQAELADHNGSRTLIEHASDRLREDILECHLQPGQRLRVEHLKNEYHVSASTLREALARLVSDHLIVAEGQRGYTVPHMSLQEVEDLTRLRVFIETAALRDAIRNADDAWRQRLRDSFEHLMTFERPQQPSRTPAWEQANARFHEALLAGGATPWTQRVLRTLSDNIERYRRISIRLTGARRDIHKEHELIYQSALDGQAARASLALEAHILATPDILIRAVKDGRIDGSLSRLT